MTTSPRTVLIADDHADFRRVVRSFLSGMPGIDIVGEAVDGVDVVEKVEKLMPDIVLMDITMPFRNGLEATRIIKERWPGTKVVIVTIHDSPLYRDQADEAHANGFIPKESLKAHLADAFAA
jgi:DNA-binding NarL/FixJ family response regulator